MLSDKQDRSITLIFSTFEALKSWLDVGEIEIDG